jgi:hypothetical protein
MMNRMLLARSAVVLVVLFVGACAGDSVASVVAAEGAPPVVVATLADSVPAGAVGEAAYAITPTADTIVVGQSKQLALSGPGVTVST